MIEHLGLGLAECKDSGLFAAMSIGPLGLEF